MSEKKSKGTEYFFEKVRPRLENPVITSRQKEIRETLAKNGVHVDERVKNKIRNKKTEIRNRYNIATSTLLEYKKAINDCEKRGMKPSKDTIKGYEYYKNLVDHFEKGLTEKQKNERYKLLQDADFERLSAPPDMNYKKRSTDPEIEYADDRKQIEAFESSPDKYNCLGWALADLVGKKRFTQVDIDGFFNPDRNANFNNTLLCDKLKKAINAADKYLKAKEIPYKELSDYKTLVENPDSHCVIIAMRCAAGTVAENSEKPRQFHDYHFIKYSKDSKRHAAWTHKAGAGRLFKLLGNLDPEQHRAWVNHGKSIKILKPDESETTYQFVNEVSIIFPVNFNSLEGEYTVLNANTNYMYCEGPNGVKVVFHSTDYSFLIDSNLLNVSSKSKNFKCNLNFKFTPNRYDHEKTGIVGFAKLSGNSTTLLCMRLFQNLSDMIRVENGCLKFKLSNLLSPIPLPTDGLTLPLGSPCNVILRGPAGIEDLNFADPVRKNVADYVYKLFLSEFNSEDKIASIHWRVDKDKNPIVDKDGNPVVEFFFRPQPYYKLRMIDVVYTSSTKYLFVDAAGLYTIKRSSSVKTSHKKQKKI